jgi:UDP-N-acetylmuramate dehydrogenase
MIRYFEKYSLQKHHTFATLVNAKYFFEFTEVADLQELIRSRPLAEFGPVLVLGGGSNLLFVSDFDGLVIYPHIPGILPEKEDANHVWVRAGAGVEWDDFVEFTVNKGWGGIENLSLIPGKVGATPVQNIGAYGQEAADSIQSVNGIDLRTGEEWDISAADCRFAYRNSIFKQELKGKFLVTSVLFKLNKFPQLNLSYDGVIRMLEGISEPTVADVRKVIVEIRSSKLPDPAVIGNAGSFFKNPVVGAELATHLALSHPGMPQYAVSDPNKVKLSAGWLIDQCGWKGATRGGAGVHERHALVLVNRGTATGREIYDLSEEIRQSVIEKYGVALEREVLVIGATGPLE